MMKAELTAILSKLDTIRYDAEELSDSDNEDTADKVCRCTYKPTERNQRD
jgi:hypothetical protein